jgi:RNA polymerase sigma-70 factor (ECF subfamily)
VELVTDVSNAPTAAPDTAEALAIWVRPHLAVMTRLAARLAPSAERDDIVQQALVRAWQKRAQYDPVRGTASSWLLAITADRARRVTRRRRPTAELTDAPMRIRSTDEAVDVELAVARRSPSVSLACWAPRKPGRRGMAGPEPGQGDATGGPEVPEPIVPPTEITPDAATPSAAPVPPDAPTQRTGIISAAPVGWSAAPPPSTPPSDQPVVAWAPPAGPARPVAGEGLVIAGVFSRLVAFAIDVLILGCISIAIGVVVGVYREGSTQALVLGVGLVGVAIDGLYFVALWTSGWRATLGMRLIGIRVLQAADGGTLPLEAAVVRWLALTGIVQLLAIVPVAGGVLGLVALAWVVVLLITTSTDRLRQGFHDHWAGSVVAQPAPGGSGAAVVGCLVLLALALFLPFIVFLLVSDDLRDILSRVGTSI